MKNEFFIVGLLVFSLSVNAAEKSHCGELFKSDGTGQNVLRYTGNTTNWYWDEGQTLATIAERAANETLHRNDFEALATTLEIQKASDITKRWLQIMRVLIYTQEAVTVLDSEMEFFDSLQRLWTSAQKFKLKFLYRIHVINTGN